MTCVETERRQPVALISAPRGILADIGGGSRGAEFYRLQSVDTGRDSGTDPDQTHGEGR